MGGHHDLRRRDVVEAILWRFLVGYIHEPGQSADDPGRGGQVGHDEVPPDRIRALEGQVAVRERLRRPRHVDRLRRHDEGADVLAARSLQRQWSAPNDRPERLTTRGSRRGSFERASGDAAERTAQPGDGCGDLRRRRDGRGGLRDGGGRGLLAAGPGAGDQGLNEEERHDHAREDLLRGHRPTLTFTTADVLVRRPSPAGAGKTAWYSQVAWGAMVRL